jgi:hypothetical protein
MNYDPKKIIVLCGKVEKTLVGPPNGDVGTCVGCGTKLWVSPNTVPNVMKAIENNDEVDGYALYCNNCGELIAQEAKAEGEEFKQIPNPDKDKHLWN